MSLATAIQDLAVRIGTEAKALRTLLNGNAADLSTLNTTAKTNLVAAVNELKAEIAAAAQSGGASINDTGTSTTSVWSSDKTDAAITSAINALLDGAPAALDTLNELAAALGDDAAFEASITTALANRVRVDVAQGLTAGQQTQARANIGAQAAAEIGDTTTDFVAAFNTALA